MKAIETALSLTQAYKLGIERFEKMLGNEFAKAVESMNKTIIEFNIINPKMRPVSASADAFEVKNISKVSISQKNDINLRILYDKTNSMEDKYLKEQFSIG